MDVYGKDRTMRVIVWLLGLRFGNFVGDWKVICFGYIGQIKLFSLQKLH